MLQKLGDYFSRVCVMLHAQSTQNLLNQASYDCFDRWSDINK